MKSYRCGWLLPTTLAGLVLGGLPLRGTAQETPAPPGPGTHAYALLMNGSHRSYTVHVPPSYDGKQAVPLVVVLHGRGSSGEEAERSFGMDEIADREGFLVAYPDALGGPRSAT